MLDGEQFFSLGDHSQAECRPMILGALVAAYATTRLASLAAGSSCRTSAREVRRQVEFA